MATPPRSSGKMSTTRNGGVSVRAMSATAILDAVPDMMFRLDRDGCYLQFKPAKGMEPIVPPDEFLGRKIAEVMPEDVASECLKVIRRALATGEQQVLEYLLAEESGLNSYEARMVPLSKDDVLCIVRLRSTLAKDAAGANGNRYDLTNRELAVLQAVAHGLTDKAVAQRLSISPLTVRKHVASIRKKMGAQSRTEASVRALKDGLVS